MGLSAWSFIVTCPEHEEHRIFQKVFNILAEITSRMPKIFRSWQAGQVKALIQRVEEAAVDVIDGDSRDRVGSIGRGLCVLLGVTHDDTTADAERIAEKISHLRVFDDDDGVMNLSATEIGAELLIVSQFTLYGNTSKGRRPSWIAAAPPEVAEPLIDHLVARLRDRGFRVETGRFRSEMKVSIVNDGPVTVTVESASSG